MIEEVIRYIDAFHKSKSRVTHSHLDCTATCTNIAIFQNAQHSTTHDATNLHWIITKEPLNNHWRQWEKSPFKAISRSVTHGCIMAAQKIMIHLGTFACKGGFPAKILHWSRNQFEYMIHNTTQQDVWHITWSQWARFSKTFFRNNLEKEDRSLASGIHRTEMPCWILLKNTDLQEFTH